MAWRAAHEEHYRDWLEMLMKFSFWRKVPVWMRCLQIASGIAVASLALIYQPVKIEGNSMTPLLSNHEAIIINRLVYHLEPIRRGDVVVFSYPLDDTESFIKRIVGLPGETVQIRQGLVYVNGSWIPEPYVPIAVRGSEQLWSYSGIQR
jgi:signal peptidase I